MSDAYYQKQEEFLRYTLKRFTDFLMQAKTPRTDRQVVLGFLTEDIIFRPGDATITSLIDMFIREEPRSAVGLILDGNGNVLSVSRRNKPDDLGLPGGKIDPGERPEEAVAREVEEETGVKIENPTLCFKRVDESDGRVSWCFRVDKWSGEPRQREDGINVAWVPLGRLLEDNCTFRDYNRSLFEALGLV